MASSLLHSTLSAPAANDDKRGSVGSTGGFLKSSFFPSTRFNHASSSWNTAGKKSLRSTVVAAKDPLGHIPKQFREENLAEGVIKNYENFPQSLYGLNPNELDMFMREDSPIKRQWSEVTEESLRSSLESSVNSRGRRSVLSSLSRTATFGGGGRRHGRRGAPPDLPSLLLDSRIVWISLPIFPAVAELVVSEFLWLNYDDYTKPIYVYIASTGTQDENKELVGNETDAYSIADVMRACRTDVYTVNMSIAAGQAAMLLSLGTKGKRFVMPLSVTQLYLPKTFRSSGPVSDMWIQAQELEVNTQYYLELLEKGIGKPREEIREDIKFSKWLTAEEAVAYGVADKIIQKRDEAFEKKDYVEMAEQKKSRRGGGGIGQQAAPSG